MYKIVKISMGAVLAAAAVTGLAGAKRFGAGASRSTEGGVSNLRHEITPQVRAAVHRGLQWLVHHQSADGSFGTNGGPYGSTGITSLCGIAFMAGGSLPNQGPYASNVRHALHYVLANCRESGLISGNGYGSPMYGHGFSTLFLAEVYGEDPTVAIKEKLEKAIRLIIETQNPHGGWRYQPVPADADLSVTICEVMALRAARDAGIKVPKRTIKRAISFVRKLQNPDGGFSYMLGNPGSAFPRSAAGLAALFYMGIYSGKVINNAVKYILLNHPGAATVGMYHFAYGSYYATQAMFMAGGHAWAQWWPLIRKQELQRQQPDGSWNGEAGEPYGTAMALIVMQIPDRYLPVLQR